MDTSLPSLPVALLLFVGMLLFLEMGRRVGMRWLTKRVVGERDAFSTMETALFALFGLLIGFTFSGALDRFDARRRLITEEANAIDTAYARLELVSEPSRTELKQTFRDYVDSRIETYRRLPNTKAADEEVARTNAIGRTLWTQSVAATRAPDAHADAGKILLPALNTMFDMTATRMMANRMHTPIALYVMLLLLALWCASLAGHAVAAVKPRSVAHTVAFAAFTAGTVFLILEFEYPRRGFIRIDPYDQVLVDTRARMT